MTTPAGRLHPIATCSDRRPHRTLGCDRRGSVAVMTAIMLPALLGFAALATEVASWQGNQIKLQRTADLSALAAAKLLNNGSTAQVAANAATDLAEINGTPASARSWSSGTNTLSDSNVTVALVTGVRSASDQAFKVTIKQSVAPSLSALFLGTNSFTMTVNAWAELVQTAAGTAQPCIFALAKETTPGSVLGVNINGGSGFNGGGCVIRANADVQIKGGTTATTAGIYSGGDVWIGGGTKVQGNGGAATNVYTNNDISVGYDFGGGSDGGATLTGAAYAAGNINVNGASTITSTAQAGGAISLNSGFLNAGASAVGGITMNSGGITGSTVSGGAITMNSGTISGSVSGSGALTLNNGASISGTTSAGSVTENVGTITGAVNSTGATTINNGSRINGNVDSSSINITNGYITGNTISTTAPTYPGWESNAISGSTTTGSAPADPSAPASPGSPGTISDPYASNTAVQTALSGLGSAGSALNLGWSATPWVVSPGTYSSITVADWQTFSNSSTVIFQPGTYYVNGDINLQGLNITGSGVTFVTSGKVAISAATVSLTAPLSGATSGIPGVLFAGNTTQTFDMAGGSTVALTGVVYFPKAGMQVSGGVTAGSSNCLELIANTITITGGSKFGSTCSTYGATTFSATPPVTVVALVQ